MKPPENSILPILTSASRQVVCGSRSESEIAVNEETIPKTMNLKQIHQAISRVIQVQVLYIIKSYYLNLEGGQGYKVLVVKFSIA